MNAKSQHGSAKSQVARANSQSVIVTFTVVNSETAMGVCEFAVGACGGEVIPKRWVDQAQKFGPLNTPGGQVKMGEC